MALRVSIPPENAKKILSYLISGQLNFITGEISINEINNEFHIINGNSISIVDSIINATGTPRSPQDMDSLLIHDLIESGIASKNNLGGIDVCKDKYCLFDKNTILRKDIFAIGEITNGRFLFTSALDIIIRHAHACADSLESIIKEDRLFNFN